MPVVRFPGGVHPRGMAAGLPFSPSETLPVPQAVYLPLESPSGLRFTARVRPDDTVRLGQVVAESDDGSRFPMHATVSGRVEAIAPHPHPAGFSAETILIRSNEHRDRTRTPDRAKEEAPPSDPKTLLHRIRRAGILGTDGRPFYEAVEGAGTRGIRMLIVNAADSDPALCADFRTLEEQPDDVLAGVRAVLRITAASEVRIAVLRHRASGLKKFSQRLGRTNRRWLTPMEDKYPAGSPAVLASALGRTRPGAVPGNPDVFVESASVFAAAGRAARDEAPALEKTLTVCGDGIPEPGNLRVRVGTPLRDCLERCGFAASGTVRLLVGGPMIGIAQIGVEAPVLQDTDGIVVLKPAPDPEAGPCIYCGRCHSCCPVRLFPQRIAHFVGLGRIDKARRHGLEACIGCGCCSFICPAKIRLTPVLLAGRSGRRRHAGSLSGSAG
jgi:Na+-translocating ferredoxin:NAD+ oxidoreductase subunit C